MSEVYYLSMRSRRIAAAVLAIILAAPLVASERGSVLFETRTRVPGRATPSHELWLYLMGHRYAVAAGGTLLIHKTVPYSGPGRLLIPASDQIVFHHERTVSVWDGVYRNFVEPGKGYTEIFSEETELGEIAPMRSGNFLVPQRWNDRTRGAKLIQFNLGRRVAEYAFPEVIDPATNRALGATHIELLADQCTVLYTFGSDHPAANRVGRLDICTGQPQPDFATLVAGEYAGSIRQVPNGDVLVANGSAVLRFNAAGSLLRTYQFPGVTHLALTTDGKAFWAGGVDQEKAHLRRFDLATPNGDLPPSVQLGNDQMQTLTVPLETSDVVVIGEWRAATAPTWGKPRGRAVRR